MSAYDRRSFFNDATAVDNGILLATFEGTGAALEYMRENGVSREVALRVLAAPEFQRRCQERRRTQRC